MAAKNPVTPAAPHGVPGRPVSEAGLAVPAGTQARRDIVAVAVVVAVLIAAMQIASYFAPAYIMPAPAVVLQALTHALSNDVSHIVTTLLRLAAAVVFAMAVGTLIGLVMGTFAAIRPYLRSLLIIDTGIPALSWMLVAVFWFSNPEARIFFILTVILLPFYAMNVHEGMRALPKEWVEMFESFRPTRWQVLRLLVIPHIVAYILMTTKSVIGYAIRMVIFAELLASAVGIGARMSLAQSTLNMDKVLAWTFFLVVLNMLLQWIIAVAEKRLLKWRPEVSVR